MMKAKKGIEKDFIVFLKDYEIEYIALSKTKNVSITSFLYFFFKKTQRDTTLGKFLDCQGNLKFGLLKTRTIKFWDIYSSNIKLTFQNNKKV